MVRWDEVGKRKERNVSMLGDVWAELDLENYIPVGIIIYGMHE